MCHVHEQGRGGGSSFHPFSGGLLDLDFLSYLVQCIMYTRIFLHHYKDLISWWCLGELDGILDVI